MDDADATFRNAAIPAEPSTADLGALRVEALRRQRQGLREQLALLRRRACFEPPDDATASLRRELVTLRERVQVLLESLEHSRGEARRAAADVEALTAERDELRKAGAAAEAAREATPKTSGAELLLEARVSALRKERDAAHEQTRSLRVRLHDIDEEREHLAKEIQRLTDQLHDREQRGG